MIAYFMITKDYVVMQNRMFRFQFLREAEDPATRDGFTPIRVCTTAVDSLAILGVTHSRPPSAVTSPLVPAIFDSSSRKALHSWTGSEHFTSLPLNDRTQLNRDRVYRRILRIYCLGVPWIVEYLRGTCVYFEREYSGFLSV